MFNNKSIERTNLDLTLTQNIFKSHLIKKGLTYGDMVARRVPIGQSHHDVERGQGEHEVEEGPGVVNSVVLRVVRFTCNKPGGYILHFPPPPPSKIGKKLQIPNKNRSSNNTATNYLRTDPPLRSWTRDRSDAQCRSSSTWRPGPSNLSCAVAK